MASTKIVGCKSFSLGAEKKREKGAGKGTKKREIREERKKKEKKKEGRQDKKRKKGKSVFLEGRVREKHLTTSP